MTEDFHVPNDWYATFFTEPFNRFWEMVVPAETTRAETDFILQHLGLEPGAEVLDAPCGAGRHALSLAERGFRVTGVDLSEDAIARARAAAAGRDLPVRFVLGDMREPPEAEGGLYAGAVCMGNSLSYLSPEETEIFVRRLAARLKPGARLVADTGTAAESILPHLTPSRAMDFPGGRYEAQNLYSAEEGLLRTKVRLTLDGRTHEGRYAHRVFTVAEWLRVMKAGGFACLGLYGGPDGAPYEVGSPRLYGVFER